MRVAHLILAHKNPLQLEMLIKALRHPGFDIYIHLDKKTDSRPFAHLFEYDSVFAVRKRTRVYWAGFGTIQATLNGFEQISGKNYDYVNVISGQDFPLKSPTTILAYLSRENGKEFITCESVRDEWPEAAVRMERYYLINYRFPGRYRIENILNRLLPKRKFPLDFEIVGRSNWFTITGSAVNYILAFLKKNPSVLRFFRWSWGADECIFSTVLYNSAYRERITKNLVYTDWTEKKATPKILGVADFESLRVSGKLFARKFDPDTDSGILSLIQESY